MDDNSFHLNWDRHLQVLAVSFNDLIAKKQYSDVTICTENGSIPAHRIILSSCSQYFKALFDELNSEHTNSNHPIVVVKDVDYDTMIQLLRFMYVGAVDVNKSNISTLINAARSFKVIGMESIAHHENQAANEEDVTADEEGPEDVQGKELDLSRNGPSRQYSCPASFVEERSVSGVPKLLAPQKAHLNPSIINRTAFPPFDNSLFNTALAMRTTPQYLSAQLNSPSRPNLSCPNLPKQSPHKSRVDSPKRQSLEALHRDNLTLGGSSRRFSNSPEESANINASLDLTKTSSANSPLNRLTASVHPSLSSLVSVGHTPATQADLHHALASKLQQFHQMHQSPHIRVSQTLLPKRSRSRSPETIESKMAKVERHDRDLSPGRYPTSHRENSPHDSIHSNKQIILNNNNSSGGSSSEHNNYSEDESGDEDRAEEHGGRDRSVSPGPSTSTPTVIDGFNHTKPGYGPLSWNYPQTGDDAVKPSSDAATSSSDILAALVRANNPKHGFDQRLLNPSVNALFAGIPRMPIPPHTIAGFQALTNSVSLASSGQRDSLLNNTLVNPFNNPMAAMLLADHERAMQERAMHEEMQEQHHNTSDERNRNRKKKTNTSTGMRYNCDACTRSYASHGNLKRHKKYECGQPPTFSCPCCPVMFQHRHSMKIHLKSAHKDEYERMTERERNPDPVTVPEGNSMTATQITNVTCPSPSSSPQLEIAEDYPNLSEYPNGGRSMPSVSGNTHLGNTHADVGKLIENSVQRNSGIASRTIATAEVSVASMSPKNLDHNFVALQRAQSQSSNTDNV